MSSPLPSPVIDADVRAALSRLTVTPDGAEFILARPDLGVYVAVPGPGAVLVEALQDGASLADAGARASADAGEEVDAADFLTGLGEAGLLDPPGGTAPVPAGAPMRWVDRIPPRVLAPLFGRVAWTLYVAAGLTAVGLLIFRWDLRPLFDDIWFIGDPIWSLLALFAVSIVITMGHECWHWLAGRALGVTPRFRVSRRGAIVVFETDLSQLVTLPRRQRYSPLLAGYAFDVTLLAIALLMRLGYREEILSHPPWFDRFLGALVFRQVIVLIWQVSGVAFRSDTYAVLANALGCHNLYRTTTLTVRRGLWRLTRSEADELAATSPHDRAVANWFWLVYVAGGFFIAWALLAYVVPFTYGMLSWIVPNLRTMALDTFLFWQSFALVAVLVGQFAVIPFIARRERRLAQPAEPRPADSDDDTVRSPDRVAWRAAFAVLVIAALLYIGNDLKAYATPTDAAPANAAAALVDSSCLPGEQVTILDFPHLSVQDMAQEQFNSNPPTSGAHYGAAVAPGIYGDHLVPGLTVHAMEHGRVIIHYRPDIGPAVRAELESIARQYTRDTVLHPSPDLDVPLALTAWGRLLRMEQYDRAMVVDFVDRLRNRYNHHATIALDECTRPDA